MTSKIYKMILDMPAMEPPNGSIANFVDPSNLRKEFTGILIASLAISSIAAMLRLYANLRFARNLTLEDSLLYISWSLFTVGFGVIGTRLSQLPIGAHQYNLTIRQLREQSKFLFFGSLVYGPAMCALKVSICLMCLRVFSTGRRNFVFWALHAIIWINLIMYALSEFLIIFSCRPIARAWDPLATIISTGICMADPIKVRIGQTCVNALTDVLMFIVPQWVIWSLQMRRNRKLGLSVVFGAALLACAASITGMYYAVKVSKDTDSTYLAAMLYIWNYSEIACGFLVACLPNVPQLARHVASSPLLVHIGTRLRSFRHISQASDPSASIRDNIGKSTPRFKGVGGGGVVSDVEFVELVIRTDHGSLVESSNNYSKSVVR